MSKTKYYTFFLLFFSAFFACTVISDNSSDALKVLYDGKSVSSDKNIFTIYIPNSKGISDVGFTLEVGDGATLSYDNKALLLNEYNQYITNMDFSNGKQHTFFVTAQGGNVSTYIIRVQLMDSKEIISFTFFKKDNSDLEEDTAMDIDANGQVVSKTVTNVEKITQLVPTISHNGSDVSPSSGVAQDFSTNNTYTVTAIDGTTSNYTVTLTSYYGVTFNANGGLIGGDPTVTEYILYGEKATPPSDPSQEHYGFKGWYDAITGGNIFDFNTPITTATIVYAQWSNKQYQVRFYQGADLLDTVLVASLTAIPAINYPVHPIPGQTYEWYSDNNLAQAYDKNSLVDSSFDLYTPILNFQKIIKDGIVPDVLAGYDNMSKQVLSRYTAGATVAARYVKETGTGDGSSWANARGDIQAVVDGIGDASENKVYVVLVASGTYKPANSYVMKNHVALVGGFTSGSYDRSGETRLDGKGSMGVFDNKQLDNTALLYGVTIANGKADNGGGMYSHYSSPTLINVTFSGNTADDSGGGIYNSHSSPVLINVTFSGNEANEGGGMYNAASSPTLINITFSGNVANEGGGMYNTASSPTLINVTFSENNVISGNGGGIYHDGNGQPLTLINTILWDNNNGNIYLLNNTADTETVNLYYSRVGETTPPISASGIRLDDSNTIANPVAINSTEVVESNPQLGSLANSGGEVATISIGNGSPVKDKGVYVRGVKADNTTNTYSEADLYYSIDNANWHSDPDLTGSVPNLSNDADDLTATDARGYGRVGRPDMGAYEKGGIAP